MNNKPILFNTDMVKAILAGRKTQMRRIVKPQPELERSPLSSDPGYLFKVPAPKGQAGHDMLGRKNMIQRCPHGQPSDLLWVRETWAIKDCGKRVSLKPEAWPDGWPIDRLQYIADESPNSDGCWWSKRASIHMPRWASRLTLKITDIRIERVQDISEQNACKEGVNPDKETNSYKDSFMFLWDKVYSNWDSNPWVWVIDFDVIQKNIDEILKASS